MNDYVSLSKTYKCTMASIMFQGGNIALAMAQFLGPKVGAVCVQVLLFLPTVLFQFTWPLNK